jgi:hypothetical protein
MAEINEDIIAQVYRSYQDAPHSRGKSEALVAGAQEVLYKLNRYVNDQDRFKEKSEIALSELENILNRFYYQDTLFIDRMMYEARAFVLEKRIP